MQKSDPANQIEPTADSLLEKRQRRTIPRWHLVLVGILVGIGLLAFVAMRPSALPGKFPSGFSDAEKREILSCAHTDALQQSFKSFTHGQVARAWRWVRTAQRQRVWAIGNQPDGQIWVHMGVEDKSQPNGYWLSARSNRQSGTMDSTKRASVPKAAVPLRPRLSALVSEK